MNTVFEVFGIENKETKVSNLFAFYFRESKEFLDLVCELAGIRLKSYKRQVKREYFFVLDGYNNKQNYIDILIRIGDIDNPEQIICIENKIYADEGYKQTERYKKGMEKEFPNAEKKYIYLSKNNSYIKLSSLDFIQIKYIELAKAMKEKGLLSLPYAKDFYEYYFSREEALFSQFALRNDVLNSNEFIDYLLWKARNMNDVYVNDGASARGGQRFFQISKSNWAPSPMKHNEDSIELTFHLESADNGIVYLHFETKNYVPFSKLKKVFGEDFYNEYVKKRNNYRKLFEAKSGKISGKMTLTVAVFHVNENEGCNDRMNKLFDLIKDIDKTIEAL